MKMFKELASLKDAKVKSAIVSESSNLSLSLNVTLTKGCMSLQYTGWGSIFEYKMGDNLLGIDDYDDNGISNVVIGGIEIDSISKFMDTLCSSGMSSVANTLDVCWDERRVEFCKLLASSEAVKRMYPGKVFFDTLPLKKRQDIIIDFCIKEDNYKYHLLSQLGIVEKSNMTPTQEQLLQFKKDRVTIKSIES